MPKHWLITGGAGFVGSHLAERLVGQGDHVTLFDDLSTGRVENIAHLLKQPGVEFIRQTVEDETAVNIAAARADGVFHLAAAVGVQLIVDKPVHTIRTIIRGTEVVLEAASRFHRPILITSSSEGYGKGSRVPFAEDDDVVMGPTRHARWCYAYAKGIDEFLGLAYHKQFDTPSIIVRLFNTVGPRQGGMYGMVLPRFADAALAGRPLQGYGDGTQTRCFCHVHDVVEALVKLMQTESAVGRVFNLGGTEEVSINDLAKRVIAAAGSDSPIEHVSYEQAYGQQFDDLPRRVPDLSRIREAIGFAPKHSLDQIIASVIDERR